MTPWLLLPPAVLVLWIIVLRATMSAPAARGPLAPQDARVVIIKPAFSNAEIAIYTEQHGGQRVSLATTPARSACTSPSSR